MDKPIRINVTIKPHSKKGPLVLEEKNGNLTVFVRQPATEGKANTALIKLLAGHYQVAKSQVKIIHGVTSKHKVIEITGSD
jgi:hypothetical protein